jgi:DNA repair protein RadC
VEGSDSIIIAHNHPSGDITPSDADIKLTQTLLKAGKLLLIPLLDHIIFTDRDKRFFSFQVNKTQSMLQTQREKYVMKNCRDRTKSDLVERPSMSIPDC